MNLNVHGGHDAWNTTRSVRWSRGNATLEISPGIAYTTLIDIQLGDHVGRRYPGVSVCMCDVYFSKVQRGLDLAVQLWNENLGGWIECEIIYSIIFFVTVHAYQSNNVRHGNSHQHRYTNLHKSARIYNGQEL